MSKQRILTDDQIDEMAELREAGWTYQRISDHFAKEGIAISANALHWQCLRVGADAPPEKRRDGIQRTEPYLRGRFMVHPFSPSDDRRLIELEADGLNTCQIARRMGRKPNSVKGRLMTLARREARAEDA